MVGCSPSKTPETTVNHTASNSLPPQAQNGKPEIFTYGGLKLEVTNVREIKAESITDEMGNPWEYKVFICYPDAIVTILDADMMNPEFTGDGKPHADWAILSASGERTDIVDDMQPFHVSSNMVYIYDPESSMAVLKIEIHESDE